MPNILQDVIGRNWHLRVMKAKWPLSRLLETMNIISDADYDKPWNASYVSKTFTLFTKIVAGNISVGYCSSMTFCWICYNKKMQFISRSLFYSNELTLITASVSNPLVIEYGIQHNFYHINLGNIFFNLTDNNRHEQLSVLSYLRYKNTCISPLQLFLLCKYAIVDNKLWRRNSLSFLCWFGNYVASIGNSRMHLKVSYIQVPRQWDVC